jgi:hypothetical protein
MMSKTNLAILMVSAVIGLVTFAFARASRGDLTSTRIAPVDNRPRWGRVGAIERWLELSPEQSQIIARQSPTFLSDIVNLRDRLALERDQLAKLFEDPSVTDQRILEQTDRLIALGSETERLVTRYILTLRKHLTPQQQRKLFELCATGVRQQMAWCGRGRGGGAGFGAGRGYRGGAGLDNPPARGSGGSRGAGALGGRGPIGTTSGTTNPACPLTTSPGAYCPQVSPSSQPVAGPPPGFGRGPGAGARRQGQGRGGRGPAWLDDSTSGPGRGRGRTP